MTTLEAVDLDRLGIKLQTFLLVYQKFLDILALIPLELDHLAHLSVVDNSAIASCSEGKSVSDKDKDSNATLQGPICEPH
jgi:hypothetical protein